VCSAKGPLFGGFQTAIPFHQQALQRNRKQQKCLFLAGLDGRLARPLKSQEVLTESHIQVAEVLADLEELSSYTSSPAGEWGGIAPDGSALFVRGLSTDEIYALDLELP